jgi:AcrR family transcriptional regulator
VAPTPSARSRPDWRRAGVQERSQRTEAALARALAELTKDRPFEDISVADVAKRAGVAVGTVYRRFRDKRAMLHLADTAFVDDCRRAFDDELSDERMDGLGLEQLARAYIDLMIRKFREHRTAILQVQRNADPRDAAVYARRAAEFNAHVHGRFRSLLRRRRDEITHPGLETALNLAIFFASAAARDAVWRQSLKAYPIQIDDAALVNELTRAFVAYLQS